MAYGRLFSPRLIHPSVVFSGADNALQQERSAAFLIRDGGNMFGSIS